MGKFTSFDAPQGVAGPTDSGTATAEDFGPGKALAAVGTSITQFGSLLREREDKRAITSARAEFSEFQLQFQQDEIIRQRDAPVGAPGHFEQSKQAFDDGVTKLTANMNDVQKNALAGLIGTARTSNLTSSMKFQAESIVKGDLNNIGIIQKGIAAQLHAGTLTLKEGMALLQKSLIDTNIGAIGQQDLAIKALPDFRKSVLNGLLENPTEGWRKLRDKELRGFPPEELITFKKDLVERLLGATEQAKKERFANEVTANIAAFDVVINGGTLEQLDKMRGNMGDETYNQLKRMIIKRDRPVRTIEEQTTAYSDLQSRYTELGVKLKNKKRVSSADIEELLRFQTNAIKLVNDGFLSEGEARRFINNVEEVVQATVGSADTGFWGLPFIDVVDDKPFNLGNEKIIDHVKKNKLTKSEHARIAKIFNQKLDNAGIKPGTEQTGSRDTQVQKLVDESIKEYIQQTVPATRGMKDVPNAVISKGKVIPGAPGKRNLEADKTVGTDTQVEIDKVNNTYARVTRNKDGKAIAVEPITRKQALTPPPTPVAPLQAGRVVVDQPPMGSSIEEVTSADDMPKLPEPSLELDQGAAVKEEGALQQKLAAQVEEEVFGRPAETLLVDTDPRPGVAVVQVPHTPSEKAINIVQNNLISNEGTGDDVTGIPTGEGGITEARKAEIVAKKGRPLTDEQARNEAVREDSAALHDSMPGFDVLRAEVQAAVIDLAYTVGINNVLDPVEFRSLRTAIAEGNSLKILVETLNTAIVDGKSVKGLALRRASMFNKANRDFRITSVEQLPDGTINYLSGSEVLFTFKRPRHSKSEAGKVNVT